MDVTEGGVADLVPSDVTPSIGSPDFQSLVSTRKHQDGSNQESEANANETRDLEASLLDLKLSKKASAKDPVGKGKKVYRFNPQAEAFLSRTKPIGIHGSGCSGNGNIANGPCSGIANGNAIKLTNVFLPPTEPILIVQSGSSGNIANGSRNSVVANGSQINQPIRIEESDSSGSGNITDGSGSGVAYGNVIGQNKGKRNRLRISNRTNRAQHDVARIKRTLYIHDVYDRVTEEELASFFQTCGKVVDCRICCDANSINRLAFVEMATREGAVAALDLSGAMLGTNPIKIYPSTTAIEPINRSFMPTTDIEREMVQRTVYCSNIDIKISEVVLKSFFEAVCGEISRVRLIRKMPQIAFVEFKKVDSAYAALNSSGVLLGSLPIRICPSKTPVCTSSPSK